ncbi:MAG: hypothetical protein BWY63_00278 [Chloroflexi bacterium ADurb.Bin360]|nr:MAG: hypothetical protein BWY63_00278 [Chloroflexi bacterium ADurb.Bin360]
MRQGLQLRQLRLDDLSISNFAEVVSLHRLLQPFRRNIPVLLDHLLRPCERIPPVGSGTAKFACVVHNQLDFPLPDRIAELVFVRHPANVRLDIFNGAAKLLLPCHPVRRGVFLRQLRNLQRIVGADEVRSHGSLAAFLDVQSLAGDALRREPRCRALGGTVVIHHSAVKVLARDGAVGDGDPALTRSLQEPPFGRRTPLIEPNARTLLHNGSVELVVLQHCALLVRIVGVDNFYRSIYSCSAKCFFVFFFRHQHAGSFIERNRPHHFLFHHAASRTIL